MILRLFWPCIDCTDQPACLLIGAILHSKQKSQAVTTAVIVSALPLHQLPATPQEVQQQLSDCRVAVPVAPAPAQAALAVLGVWQPLEDSSSSPVPSAAEQHGLWLVLRGRQRLSETLSAGISWRAQQLWAPVCDLQQCDLRPGIESLQVFLYAVPAQQPRCASVRLPLPPPAPQLPWMKQQPGVVSLCSVMHILQEAHAALHTSQPQPTLPRQQQPQEQQQARTRQQRRNAQQALKAAPSTYHNGWAHLAAVQAAADSRQHRSWLARQKAALSAYTQTPLQRLAQLSRVTAAASAADAGPQQDTAAASGTQADELLPGSQPDMLQLCVQHLLGLLVGLNLLLHWQLVLDAAAAAGTWLQHDVLQPHIDWLAQARPGGIKLHLELSLLLGTAATACLQAVAALYTQAWPLLGPAALLTQAAAAAVGGASWGCAAAADVLLVLLAPLVALYLLAAQAQQLQLRFLAASWRLIRGRQKVRRFSTHRRGPAAQQQQQPASCDPAAASPPSSNSSRRTAAQAGPAATGHTAAAAAGAGDSSEPADEVSVEQLIVGVLLFTPLLGLFPTTLAWYLSVCCLYGVLHVLRLTLVAVGSWMQLRPLHVLAARWRRPQLFPGQLMVLPLAPTAHTPAAGPVGGAGGSVGAGSRGKQFVPSDAAAQVTDSAAVGPSSSSQGRQQPRSSTAEHTAGALQVGHYRIFYEPLSYWEVLLQSVAQQQGLLWYACQGVQQGPAQGASAGSSSSSSSGSWLTAWLKSVAAGRVWGLRLLSTSWRRL